MYPRTLAALFCATLTLSGCENPEGINPTQSPSVPAKNPINYSGTTDRWIGHWVGVEGMVLDITKEPQKEPGHYLLTMRWGLDDSYSGVFMGLASDEGILFSRKGESLSLHAGTGEETELKWLTDKKDCLIVKAGEGYCRH